MAATRTTAVAQHLGIQWPVRPIARIGGSVFEDDRQRLLVEQVIIEEQLVRLTVENESLRKAQASAGLETPS